MAELDPIFGRANDAGVRLEIVHGRPTWEASPAYRHQKQLFRIQSSIEAIPGSSDGCGCVHVSDTYIRFSPETLKRPDIAIFCAEPPESEQDEALTLVPEAVIEIVSPGYEAKDLEEGPPIYLLYGVKDVVVFNPRTLAIAHHRKERISHLTSPTTIDLECGCRVRV